jgi:polyphosphate kinase 2
MPRISPERPFSNEHYNHKGVLKRKIYERELRDLQVELGKLQRYVSEEGLRVVVLFEGRDAAGKGGVIKRITERANPRVVRTVALGVPSDRARTQWYFQRYVAELPAAGEMVLFDRSWYNRAGVERVMGFASEEEVATFMASCPVFERMLVDEGIVLLKYWFSVSEAEQERRIRARLADPTRRWKVSDMDLEARARWEAYSRAKDEMLRHTHTSHAPWRLIDADIKRHARLNCIADVLDQFEYPTGPIPAPELPPRQWSDESYERDSRYLDAYIQLRY